MGTWNKLIPGDKTPDEKACATCKIVKPIDDFYKSSPTAKGYGSDWTGYYRRCKSCVKENRDANKDKYNNIHNIREREDRRLNPAKYLWKFAKKRATANNIPFNITPEDIIVPPVCPVFGTEFKIGSGSIDPRAPSLDRIFPEKGYVKGNIAVISHRANTLKGNASAEEIHKLASWLEREEAWRN
jgi:hypothetical protein